MKGPAEAQVDLAAITGNVEALRQRAPGPQLMAVVKADGYGHGMIPAARAALAGGAGWLGVVHVHEALALRRDGITAPVLCLSGVPGAAHQDAVRGGIDLTADSVPLLTEIATAAAQAGRPARVHLKADTGMSRGGATAAGWPGLVAAALSAQAAGHVVIVGIWSHLACADIPGHPSIAGQLAAFRQAVAVAEAAGARPEVRHLANTAATLTLPETWFDLVRPGGAVYGLATLPGGAPPLAAPGADRAHPAGPGQAGAGRHPGVLRPPVHHAGSEHARAHPAGLRGGHPPDRFRGGRGTRPGPPLAHRGHRVHGPVRPRLRRGTSRGRR